MLFFMCLSTIKYVCVLCCLCWVIQRYSSNHQINVLPINVQLSDQLMLNRFSIIVQLWSKPHWWKLPKKVYVSYHKYKQHNMSAINLMIAYKCLWSFLPCQNDHGLWWDILPAIPWSIVCSSTVWVGIGNSCRWTLGHKLVNNKYGEREW